MSTLRATSRPGSLVAPAPAVRRWRSLLEDFAIYVGRMREFTGEDWLVYIAWIGLMTGLTAGTFAFIAYGRAHGADFPTEAFLVPAGALVFTLAIAIDTIGHRTIYRLEIARAEQLVHHVTIACGVSSCLLLCAAWQRPALFWIPAMVTTVLSFVYSLVDEVFHWRRYISTKSDWVEMWSHLFILLGHGTMMLGWWRWFQLGYPGVRETVAALAAHPVVSL